MIQVTNEIHQVGGSGLTGPEEAIYLIRFGEEAALVDAGCDAIADPVHLRDQGNQPSGG